MHQNALLKKGTLQWKHSEAFKANPENKQIQSHRRFMLQLFALTTWFDYDFPGLLPKPNVRKQTSAASHERMAGVVVCNYPSGHAQLESWTKHMKQMPSDGGTMSGAEPWFLRRETDKSSPAIALLPVPGKRKPRRAQKSWRSEEPPAGVQEGWSTRALQARAPGGSCAENSELQESARGSPGAWRWGRGCRLLGAVTRTSSRIRTALEDVQIPSSGAELSQNPLENQQRLQKGQVL